MNLVHAAACSVAILGSGAIADAGSIIYVDDDAPPGGDGLSWATAHRFLRDALAHAGEGEASVVTEIRVGEGTYRPDRSSANPGGTGDRGASFEVVNGADVLGGYAGLPAGDPDERDPSLYPTVLTGDLLGDDAPGFVSIDDNSWHVVRAVRVADPTTISGVSIVGGHVDNDGDDLFGAGLLVRNSSLTLDACRIVANRHAASGTVGGAGMFAEGSAIDIRGCTIADNFTSTTGTNPQNRGGGLYLVSSTVRISDTDLVANRAGQGGGVNNALGSLAIDGCLFRENVGGGGAIFNAGTLVASSSRFVDNVWYDQAGSRHGGAVHCSNSADETYIANCEFTGGMANRGGAIYCFSDNLVIANSLFYGNTAGRGAAVAFWTGIDLEMSNSTVVGNTTTSGSSGTIHVLTSLVEIRNSILWGNTPTEIASDAPFDPAVEHSVVQGGWPGTGNLDADPAFVDPPAHDYRLSAGSVAIDAGTNLRLPADEADLDGDGVTTEPIPLDLDEAPRFMDDRTVADTGCGAGPLADIGAYEFPGAPPDHPYRLGDLDASGIVGIPDLLILLSTWGLCGECCLADLDLDTIVHMRDLMILLENWG
jgi:hypothetical protein